MIVMSQKRKRFSFSGIPLPKDNEDFQLFAYSVMAFLYFNPADATSLGNRFTEQSKNKSKQIRLVDLVDRQHALEEEKVILNYMNWLAPKDSKGHIFTSIPLRQSVTEFILAFRAFYNDGTPSEIDIRFARALGVGNIEKALPPLV
ncbi:MAG: hypothetical protein H7A33_05955 [Deltaproteobacteria bacterium]|nr:hypothetical protein [Deltaproteobacteria bacterium]